MSRKTVKRYIDQYTSLQQKLETANKINAGELIEDLVNTPKYNSSTRIRHKATSAVMARIQYYLNVNKEKRTLGQRKQQMKKIDIFESLKDEGFDIGYTTVCNLINELENKGKEAFIKQTYDLGDVCEFDWGEVKIFIDGILKTYQLAVFTSAAGNYRYGYLFNKQNTSSFQQSHALFFDKIGGSYRTMVYDNMRVAVKKFVGVTDKEPTDGLLKLSIYYNFDFRFCNVRKGNEKGHVERSVEYLRRKAFSVKDHFNNLEEANQYLNEICNKLNLKPQLENDNKSATDILQLEQKHLLTYKPKFDCAELKHLRVNSYSAVSIDTCHYSVPEQYVGKVITAKIYPYKIIFSFEDKNICEHKRIYGFYKWSMNIEHYIKTLIRKPGAVHDSLAMKQLDKRVQDIYKEYYVNNPKDFIALIEFMKKSSITIIDIETAISKLKAIRTQDITTDKIKVICERKDEAVTKYQTNTNCTEIENNCKSQLKQTDILFKHDKILNNKAEVVI